MPTPASLSATPPLMSGLPYWTRSYGLMMRWELTNLRLVAPIILVVQLFMGAGLMIGFGLLFEQIPAAAALYLTTGSTVIALLIVGLVMAPQMVAQQKMAGTYDYLWSLPVPRVAQVLASLSVYAVLALPGMVLALVAARLRYDLDLSVSLMVIPAALLTILVATSVGYSFAHAIPQPMITGLVTQVLAFVILVYSPINFPADRLPGWYAAIHSVLPFQHAAVVMRDALTDGLAENVGRSYLILSLWTVAGWLVIWHVVGRRR